MNLSQKECKPCDRDVDPFGEEEVKKYLEEISEDWSLSENVDLIQRKFKFEDFQESLKFVNRVGEIAEKENHHPDVHIFYNEVVLELSTHSISGLSENDFIVAAKIDSVQQSKFKG